MVALHKFCLFICFFFLQSLSGFALLRSRCFPPFFVYIFAGFLLLLLSVGQLFRPKRLWSAQCVRKGSRMAGAVGHLNGLKGSKMGKADLEEKGGRGNPTRRVTVDGLV